MASCIQGERAGVWPGVAGRLATGESLVAAHVVVLKLSAVCGPFAASLYLVHLANGEAMAHSILSMKVAQQLTVHPAAQDSMSSVISLRDL